jgi:hypothetical protein
MLSRLIASVSWHSGRWLSRPQHIRASYGKDAEPVRVMVTIFAGDQHYLIYHQDQTDA